MPVGRGIQAVALHEQGHEQRHPPEQPDEVETGLRTRGQRGQLDPLSLASAAACTAWATALVAWELKTLGLM